MSGYTYGGDHGAQYGGEDGGLWGLPLLYPPTDLAVSNLTKTSADLSWTDNNPDEYGVGVERAKYYEDIEEWGPWREIDILGPNTESYTDDSPQPGRRYRYRVFAFNAAGRSYSNEVEGTTLSSDARQTNIRTRGWYVEVDHPDSPVPIKPEAQAQETQWNPVLNDQSRVEIAVDKDDRWEGNTFDEAPLRVWKDGKRLPIEEVQGTRREPGHDVIEGIGGVALEDDVEGVEVPEEDAHVAAEDFIENTIGYASDVDNPDTNTREGVTILSTGSSAQSWEDDLQEAPFPDDDPRYIDQNQIRCHPTAAFVEGENGSGAFTEFADSEGNDGAWSDNQCAAVPFGSTISFEWSIDYPIPDGEAIADFIMSTPEDPTPGLTFTLDIFGGGTYQLESFSQDTLPLDDDKFSLGSFEVPLNGQASTFDGEIPTGPHTITVENTGGGALYIDFIHFRDDRFSYNTDDTSPVAEVVQGWESYPETQTVTTTIQTSIEQVVAGDLTVAMDDTSSNQSIGLRNDTNDPFDTAANTLTHSVDFVDASQVLQAEVTLSRYDTGGTSGEFGNAFQSLDTLGLNADLTNTPVLIDFFEEGPAKAILNRMADAGDFIWEVRWVNGELAIWFTTAGQRVADREPSYVDYSGRRTTEGSYQHVIAQGKSERVEEQSWTSNSEYGLLSGLGNAPIVTGSETVYDPDDRSTQYERLIDYEVDHREGAIRILEGGDMEPDTEYWVDYEWRYEGEYTDPETDDPDTLRESFPAASSNRECEQIAVSVVRELAEAREEATVTIDEVDPTMPLTEAIDPEQLPFDGPMRVEDVQNQPGQIRMTLGNRQNLQDVISTINDKVRALAQST